MKKAWGIGIVVMFAAGLGGTSPAAAQGELDRLESGIRTSNGPPVVPVASTPRVYLGAVADNDAGRGVRVLSVRSGGPADRAGLQAQDLIVAAAGRKIHLLAELSAILNGLNPGDRLALEFLRGNRPLRTEVVLGQPAGAAQPESATASAGPGCWTNGKHPTATGRRGARRYRLKGRRWSCPAAVLSANSPQAQIEELRRRVDQLERRVQELEHALAESQRK